MSALKLGCLFAGAISHYLSFTPPNPAPTEDDRVHKGNLYDRIVRHLALVTKLAVLVAFISESSVVAAVAFPHALSRYPILPALCHGAPNAQSLLSISPSFLIGLGLMLSGAWLRLWCYRSMGKLFTFEVTMKPSHQLIVTGPYAYVRHPSYTAGVVHIGGLVVLHFSSGGWNRECHVMSTLAGLAVLAYLALALFSFISWDKRSKLEDELLRQRFGCEWHRYYADVPWRFLPGIC